MDDSKRCEGIDSSNSIPILVKTGSGYAELLLSFIMSKDRHFLPEPIRDVAVWIEDVEGGVWAASGITGARRIVGPLIDNMPAGEGGERISPKEAGELLKGVDLAKLLDKYRESVIDDSTTAKVIDAILKNYRGY
jgi:hypothetical protein